MNPALPSRLAALAACAGLAAVATTASALAAGPAPAADPLRADHPLLGAWTFTSPDGCVETWRIDRTGNSLVTSAGEVAEMRFTLSDQPSPRGFYKWTDTLYKDNGKKDCAGQVTKPPRTTTNFILLNRAGTRFIFCAAEDTRQCFGPFVKVEGGEV